MSVDSLDLAARVAAVVEKAGGQTQAAKLAGVSRNAIHKWRTGEARLPLLEMYALAKAAGVSLEWLATGSEATGSDTFVFLTRRDVDVNGAVIDAPAVDWREVPFRRDYLEHYGIDPSVAIVMVVSGDEMPLVSRPSALMIFDTSRTTLDKAGVFAFVRMKRLVLLRVAPRLDGGVVLSAANEGYGREEIPADATASLNVIGQVMVAVSPFVTARR